uniref:Protein krueppel n=1 Tax=Pectinophora gossypiella TaxID=13191 RepID=A0A1E1W8Z0_PECGO
MNNVDNNYCRLCAELKPSKKLLNLQTDDEKRREMIEKLTRVNASTDLSEDILPKTVCFVCLFSLDRAFEFVVAIEQAQTVLNNIFIAQQTKKEVEESCSDEDYYDVPDDVKVENLDVKQEEKEELETLKKLGIEYEARPQEKKYSPKDLSLDTIPLSQLKLTWKDYSWTCSYCETQFATIDELRTHSIQYHDYCNAFRCTDCKIRKLRLDSFLIHVKRHRKYLKLSCYKCHKRFSSPREVNIHVSKHKSTEHFCPGCNTCFTTSEELNLHTSTYYQSRKSRPIPQVPRAPDDLSCYLCKKTFKYRGSLNTHLLIHTDRKRDHTCDKCGKCFLNKQNLAGHMILHDNVRPFQCEICKASFKTHGQLRNHVGVHDNRKPFACEQCGRCFRLQKQLTSHSIIHTDALPHICSYCNKGFRFKTILNQHLRQHTGVKPYSCEVCQRDFTNWPNYNKHMKRRHGMDMAKKKHTPEGVYPIDPTTGEIIMHMETSKMIEWKQKMMSQRRPGRPKLNVKLEDKNMVQNEKPTETVS